MSMHTNCPNCGAPIQLYADKCPYCDTPYRISIRAELYQTEIDIAKITRLLEMGLITQNEARERLGLPTI